MKRSYLFGLAAAALFGGVYMQGCGAGVGGEDGGVTACTADADCGTGKLCDTDTNTCLVKCTPPTAGGTATECTGSETSCQAFHHITGTACVCTSNTDCLNGATCDTAKGTCAAASGGSSGSTGSGSDCTTNASLCNATTQHCDTTTKTCGSGATCQASELEQQGSECNYGEACFQHSAGADFWCDASAGAQCAAAKPTSTVTGASPVAYDVGVVQTGEPDTTSCNAGTDTRFTGHFYDPDGDTPTSGIYSHIIYVTADALPTSGNTQTANVAMDASSGTFTFDLCDDLKNSATGVYITDKAGNKSNVTCLTWQ
jgi:hypothetical protein